MSELSSGRPVATRVAEPYGYSEAATFFGPGPESIFGVLHRPLNEPVAGVVICPSTDSEFATYAIDVAIARALASRGVAVQRFHPRGFGHSDGQPQDVTFESMRMDTLLAVDRLVDQTGIGEVAFMGARFGGLVAASAASRHPGCPLALIEPTLDAKRFFRDAWRATLIRDVKAGSSEHTPRQGLADVLAREETADVLGYSICRRFFESASGRKLLDELDDESRRVLLVQLGRSTTLRSDIEDTGSELRVRGCEVDVEAVAEDVTWWFPRGADTEQSRRGGLVGLTSNWLVNELTAVTA